MASGDWGEGGGPGGAGRGPQQLPMLLLEFRGHRGFSARQAAQLVALGVS